MKTTFSSIVTKYFSIYLPKQRGLSLNTIKSYRDTMLQMLSFVEMHCNIPINRIESGIFDKELIVTFLEHLEVDRRLSTSSKNQRLAALHSFFKYLMVNDLECFNACQRILDIDFTRKPQIFMNYLNLEEIKLLLEVPDYSSKKGIRDLCILATLYETGSRVQELIDIKFYDVTLQLPAVIYNDPIG